MSKKRKVNKNYNDILVRYFLEGELTSSVPPLADVAIVVAVGFLSQFMISLLIDYGFPFQTR